MMASLRAKSGGGRRSGNGRERRFVRQEGGSQDTKHHNNYSSNNTVGKRGHFAQAAAWQNTSVRFEKPSTQGPAVPSTSTSPETDPGTSDMFPFFKGECLRRMFVPDAWSVCCHIFLKQLQDASNPSVIYDCCRPYRKALQFSPRSTSTCGGREQSSASVKIYGHSVRDAAAGENPSRLTRNPRPLLALYFKMKSHSKKVCPVYPSHQNVEIWFTRPDGMNFTVCTMRVDDILVYVQ